KSAKRKRKKARRSQSKKSTSRRSESRTATPRQTAVGATSVRSVVAAVARFAWSALSSPLGLIAIVGSLASIFAVAVPIYRAVPIVTPPAVDRENPLKLPFVISNDGWFTLYKVWPNCVIDYIDLGWMQNANMESAGLERWGDLRPGETRRYV